MAKYNFLQNALIGGEVTPLSRGRTDFPQYKNSLEDCKNMIPFVVGGAARRSGTNYFNKVDTALDKLNLGLCVDRLIPWELSNGERLFVALGGGELFKVIDVNRNLLVFTTFSNGIGDIGGGVGDESLYPSLGKFTTAQAQAAQYYQFGDILYIVSDGAIFLTLRYFMPNPITPVTAYVNYHTPLSQYLDSSSALRHERVPFKPVNVTLLTIASSATVVNTPTTLTSNTLNGRGVFRSTHVGAVFKLNQGSVLITAFTSETSVAGYIMDALTVGTTTIAWEESAWSDYQGWPRTVANIENRLCYGGNAKNPDTLWFAEDGDPSQFSLSIGGTPAKTDAFAVTPNGAEKVSAINWLVGGSKSAFGTEREEFTLFRPDVQAGFSVSNIQISKETNRGSKYIQAVRIESAVYFVDASGQRIVEFVFDQRENSFRNRDINIYADHIFAKFQEQHSSPRSEKIIINMCRQSDADQKLWVLDQDGGLFSCVIDRMFDVTAWSMHYLGGKGTAGSLDPAPFVGAMAPLNNKGFGRGTTEGHDLLFLRTNRKVNAVNSKYIEYIDRASEAQDDFLDFKVLLPSAATSFSIACLNFTSSIQGSYLYMVAPNGGTFSVWLDKNANGTQSTDDIHVGATTKIIASITTGQSNIAVASVIAAALNGNATFTASGLTVAVSSFTADHLIITNAGPAIVGGTSAVGFVAFRGETVSVVANGIFIGEKAVSALGIITLPLAATAVKAGFKYKSRLKTLPIEAGSQVGSALGSIERIDQARVHFYRSANASLGGTEQDGASNLDEILFRPSSVATSLPVPLFTGYKVVDLAHDYERAAQVVIETEGPLSMTITHLTLRGQTYD